MSGEVFSPGPDVDVVKAADGRLVKVPDDWTLVAPGDPGLTRRVKAAGNHWVVQEKVGRRMFSRGVWAPLATVEKVTADLEAERSTDAYAKKREADAKRRDKQQAEYVEDFYECVVTYLKFHDRHGAIAAKLAKAVADHATPVGSGTVARTKRIPVEQRAEAAVIAWMRHQTTAYDEMKIPREKGKRREVRRMLAARSKSLLDHYRRDQPTPIGCPLKSALMHSTKLNSTKVL